MVKSERLGILSLLTLFLVGCLPMMVGRQLVGWDVAELCGVLMELVRGLIDGVDGNKLKTEVGGEDDEVDGIKLKTGVGGEDDEIEKLQF